MLLIGYGFVRLSAAFSHAGCVYAFIGKTLDPGAGFLLTWMLAAVPQLRRRVGEGLALR
jgi:amino acid transporter